MYTPDLFVRKGSEISQYEFHTHAEFHDHADQIEDDHEHGSGEHFHIGDSVVGEVPYHEHGSGGASDAAAHNHTDHLHAAGATVAPCESESAHDHGHSHSSGAQHNHFHMNGMTIAFRSFYDLQRGKRPALRETNQLLRAGAEHPVDETQDVCFCDDDMIFEGTARSRVISPSKSCTDTKGEACFETRDPVADEMRIPYLGIETGWVPSGYGDAALMKLASPTPAMGVRLDSHGMRVSVEVSSDYVAFDTVFVGVPNGDVRFSARDVASVRVRLSPEKEYTYTVTTELPESTLQNHRMELYEQKLNANGITEFTYAYKLFPPQPPSPPPPPPPSPSSL